MAIRSKIWGSIVCLVVVSTATPTFGQSDQFIRDPEEVGRLLRSVSTVQGDLATRFYKAGMTIEGIRIHRLTRSEAAENPKRLSAGDVEWSVMTSGKPITPGCTVLGSPVFTKRGLRILPQDRTGVWLLTGECALPR